MGSASYRYVEGQGNAIVIRITRRKLPSGKKKRGKTKGSIRTKQSAQLARFFSAICFLLGQLFCPRFVYRSEYSDHPNAHVTGNGPLALTARSTADVKREKEGGHDQNANSHALVRAMLNRRCRFLSGFDFYSEMYEMF